MELVRLFDCVIYDLEKRILQQKKKKVFVYVTATNRGFSSADARFTHARRPTNQSRSASTVARKFACRRAATVYIEITLVKEFPRFWARGI